MNIEMMLVRIGQFKEEESLMCIKKAQESGEIFERKIGLANKLLSAKHDNLLSALFGTAANGIAHW